MTFYPPLMTQAQYDKHLAEEYDHHYYERRAWEKVEALKYENETLRKMNQALQETILLNEEILLNYFKRIESMNSKREDQRT